MQQFGGDPGGATQAELRRVLRLLRRPHELVHNAMALALCDHFRVDDSVQAVITLLHHVFNLRTPTGRRFFESIRLTDVDGLTAKESAKILGLSLRQFFRYRSEAISALAATIERFTSSPRYLAS